MFIVTQKKISTLTEMFSMFRAKVHMVVGH